MKVITLPWISIISCSLFVILFNVYPEIDIIVSKLFFKDNVFSLRGRYNGFIQFIDHFIQFGCISIWIIYIGYYTTKAIRKNGCTIIRKQLSYVCTIACGGSIALVHFIKHHFMRCRPHYTDIFGGPAQFTNPWTYNTSAFVGQSSCLSFVSGHAAIGFLLYSIAFLYTNYDSRRRYYIIIGSIVGGLFGFIRIIQGEHFLSDVIFSGYVVFFFAMIVAYILKPYASS